MERPEYWEDDETWAAWEAQAKHPETPEPFPGLKAAIERARSGPSIEDQIRLHNELWAVIRGTKTQ